MARNLLAGFFAIVVATIGAFMAPVAVSDSDDVYTVLKKGKVLNEEKQKNDELLGPKEKVFEQKKVDRADLVEEETKWKARETDYISTCVRDFIRGEEAALAACQDEKAELVPWGKELEERRKSIDAWFKDDAWLAEFNSLKQRRIELRTEINLWMSKLKINAMLKAFSGDCPASRPDFQSVIYDYSRCFDGRGTGHELLRTPCIGTCASANR